MALGSLDSVCQWPVLELYYMPSGRWGSHQRTGRKVPLRHEERETLLVQRPLMRRNEKMEKKENREREDRKGMIENFKVIDSDNLRLVKPV